MLGVNLSANIGGSLNFAFKKTSDDDPIFTVSLAVSSQYYYVPSTINFASDRTLTNVYQAIDKPLATTCFPFGDVIQARDVSSPMIRGASRRTISS